MSLVSREDYVCLCSSDGKRSFDACKLILLHEGRVGHETNIGARLVMASNILCGTRRQLARDSRELASRGSNLHFPRPKEE